MTTQTHIPNAVAEILDSFRLGQRLGAQMDSITLRAMREDWSPERYKAEIDKSIFGVSPLSEVEAENKAALASGPHDFLEAIGGFDA